MSNNDPRNTHGMLSGVQLLQKNKGKTLRWNREKFEELVLSEGNTLNKSKINSFMINCMPSNFLHVYIYNLTENAPIHKSERIKELKEKEKKELVSIIL